uniref:Major facilitator superfamily domain containing 11 n=1 Tax=Periophthalmus magnuspinnatus TaxID=409849 RepID=A0A3B3ZLN3_9GOBI
MADRRTFNVVILGVGFLFIFTAFTTCGNVEQTVVKSLGNESFSGSGYYLGIIYGIFSFSNLLAPTVVAVIGAKHSMFLSGLLYGYIAVFILPFTWSFYLTSVLIGIGAALWTAQGQFLVENSEASTINRNTGMFWALLQCMIFGNLYIYFEWNGATEITGSRKNVFLSLLVASVLGTLSFLVLRQSLSEEEMLSEEEGQSLLSTRMYKHRANSAMQDAKAEFTILQLLKSKTIVLLSPCMAYSLELSFYSGVYGTCIRKSCQGLDWDFGDCNRRRRNRGRILRATVQEQSLPTHLSGLPGNGGAFCCVLFDLPEHPGRRSCSLNNHSNEPLSVSPVSVCGRGVLLQRSPPVDVAAPGHGGPGLLWDSVFLYGGKDAELHRRLTGVL